MSKNWIVISFIFKFTERSSTTSQITQRKMKYQMLVFLWVLFSITFSDTFIFPECFTATFWVCLLERNSNFTRVFFLKVKTWFSFFKIFFIIYMFVSQTQISQSNLYQVHQQYTVFLSRYCPESTMVCPLFFWVLQYCLIVIKIVVLYNLPWCVPPIFSSISILFHSNRPYR